ncbi:MAG TPA: TonB-dependent receptor [Novosphingobium sp.]|nr:TonB-dependent receptor [Novosphingobium sp.]
MQISSRRGRLLASAIGTLALAHQAQAQTTAPAAAPAASSGAIADIVVTATRRAERLQDVPVSVTAVTSALISRQNVRDINDLPKLVPGLTLNYGSQPGNNSINLRGIGTLTNGIAVESDVAIVVDDVPLGFQAEAFKDLVDIERVEVLKGPQSTLFGKSAIAGVLNITTQAPTDHWTGHVTGLVTDDHEWRLGGTIAGPITQNLRVRLTAAHDSWDGNIHNLTDGSRMNGSVGTTVTGKLVWDAGSRLTLSVSPRYNHTDTNCCVTPIRALTPGLYYQGLSQLPASTVLAGINPNDTWNTNVRNDVRAGGISESYGVTWRANEKLEGGLLAGGTLAYIGSVDHYHLRDYQDVDGTDSPFLLYYPASAPSGLDSGARLDGYFTVRSTTQELRLTSGSGPLRYVAGLWFARNSLTRDLARGPVLQYVHYHATTVNETYSLYNDLAWDAAPRFTLVGGFRLNRQLVDYTYANTTASPAFALGGHSSDNAITGKAGAQYHFTRDNMAYFTFSTGYKGQAYDLSSVFNANIAAHSPVAPETARSYEIGSKNSFFHHRLQLNVTGFWTNYSGFQTSSITYLPNGFALSLLQSVGKLRTRGVEMDFTAKPLPRVSLNGAGAFTDARITDFPTGPCYTNQPYVTLASADSIPAPGQCGLLPSGTKIQNLKGGTMNNAPRWKFNIGGQYDLPLEKGYGAFASFAYRWQSKVNFSLNQDPMTVQGAYGVFDATLGASADDGRYKLTFFVNNLFNQHYAVNLGNTASGFSATGVAAQGLIWQPARDSFRYIGVKLDASF